MRSKSVSCANCLSLKTIRKGWYTRKRNRQKIQKYLCQDCGVWFSEQSSSPDWAQKRPDLNQKVFEMVSAGAGIRKMCLVLRTTKKTVQRKVLFNAQLCDRFHRAHMDKWTRSTKPRFQMDEMESFEEKRNQTIKVPVVVEKDSHFIVDAISIKVKSRSQYPRARERWNSANYHEIAKRPAFIKDLLQSCRKMKPQGRIVIDTDMEPTYPAIIQQAFGSLGVHVTHNASQGEGKNLFPVNNIMACLRQDVAAVRTDSWHINKSKAMLDARLKIYIFFSNYLKKKTYKQGKKRVEMTPAMHLGIFKKPVIELY